jgi:hypothetical protein
VYRAWLAILVCGCFTTSAVRSFSASIIEHHCHLLGSRQTPGAA